MGSPGERQLCQLGSASANTVRVFSVSTAEGRAAGVLPISFSPWEGHAEGSLLAQSCAGLGDGAIQVR